MRNNADLGLESGNYKQMVRYSDALKPSLVFTQFTLRSFKFQKAKYILLSHRRNI